MNEIYIDPEKDKIYHIPYKPNRPVVNFIKRLLARIKNTYSEKESVDE